MAESPLRVERVHCNICGPDKKHKLIKSHTKRGHDSSEDGLRTDLWWSIQSDMLVCQGCDEVTLRRRISFSEWDEDQFDFYPPRVARTLPSWKNKLSPVISSMLEEVYAALASNSRRLAMMGARTLIDLVMYEKVGDAGTFPEKLKALKEQGYLSEKNREVLDAALEMGNAATHRGHCPAPDHVQLVMDIVENLLQATVHHGVVDELKKATPPRPKRKKKGK